MQLKKLLLAALLTIGMVTAWAQKYEWKQAVANGFTYKYVTNDPMSARFYTLKNGLTVILSKNTKEPRITARIAVRTGSNNDPKDHTGLAHYLEHLLFKGTDKYGSLDWAKEKPLLDKIVDLYEVYNSTSDVDKRKSIYHEIDSVSGMAAKLAIANEYDKMMSSLGSQKTNAHTSVEETVYDEDIPSNAVDKYLAIQAERFRNPIFRIFHTELEAVYEEKNRGLDNDGRKVQEATMSAIFPTNNYGQQSTIGTIEHLKNPSLVAIRNYYYKYYVPNNMAIVLAGDFNPDEIIKKIDQQFGYMKPSPVADYNGPKEAPIAGPIEKDIFGPSAESVRLAFRSGASDTKEAMITDLMGSILSNGKAGLLDLNLNKQQKLLGASAGSQQFKDYGVFIVQASPKKGQTLEEVKALLIEQLKLLKSGNFDETLIKAIVANFKLGQLRALEDNGGRTDDLVDQYIKNKGTKWADNVATLDEMSRVTKKEIVEFANKFFTDDNYVVVYKRKGEDKNTVKVDKPPITPVETNSGKMSPYVKAVTETPLLPLKPVWLDYSKDIQRGKVGNAEVLYIQNKENDIFTMTYRFDMGSWNNKLLPLAAQYIQFLGTDKMSSEDISKQFYNLACNFNVNAGSEETVVSISGLQENFDKAVSLFEDLLQNCKADEAALDGMKNRLAKSRSNNKLNKQAISTALRSYATYGANNPFNYALSDDAIKNMKSEDLINILHEMRNFKHRITYYGPQSLTSLTTVLPAIHKVPAQWSTPQVVAKFERTKQTANQVMFADYDAVQAEIYWVKNLSNYDPKAEALVNLFNSYFGGGMGSIVFQTIRESKALAYSTYAVVQTPAKKEDPFAIVAYVGSQADKFNEAVVGMNELLTDMPKNQANFENARKGLMKDIETDRITKDGIIYSYLNAQKKGVDHDMRKDNYQQYANLSLSQVADYHNNQLSKQPYTYCIVASTKKISQDDLKKYGEVKVLSLDELFGY